MSTISSISFEAKTRKRKAHEDNETRLYLCGYHTRFTDAKRLATMLQGACFLPILWDTFNDGTDNIYIGRERMPNGQLLPRAEPLKKQMHNKDCVFVADFATAGATMTQIHTLIALCELGISSLTIVLPYFPTGTMERVVEDGNVATAHTLSYLMSQLPLTVARVHLVVYDLHTLQNRFYASRHTSFDLQTAIPLLKRYISHSSTQRRYDCVVFPDDGAHKRYSHMFTNVHIIVCDKKRVGEKRIVIVKEDGLNHLCTSQCFLIIDDLTQSGGTLIECARCIAEQHPQPKNIHFSAFVAHGVFNGGDIQSFITKRNAVWNPKVAVHAQTAVHKMKVLMTDSCTSTAWAIQTLPSCERRLFVVLPLLTQIAHDLPFANRQKQRSHSKHPRKKRSYSMSQLTLD